MTPTAQSRKMQRSLAYNKLATAAFYGLGALVLLLICWLLLTILGKGLPGLTLDFLTKVPEDIDPGGGIGPVLFNSFYILFLSLVVSIPIGVGAAFTWPNTRPKTS